MKKWIAFIVLLALAHATPSTQTLTDMAQRSVTLPTTLERVFGSAPPTTYLIALFAPQTLVGLNTPLDNGVNLGSQVLPPVMRTLPLLKGWHGTTSGANIEKLLEAKTQLIVAWNNPFLNGVIEKATKGTGIEVLYIEPDAVTKLPQTFTLLGSVFGMPKRGDELSRYATMVNSRLASLRASIDKKPRIYYALGANGLQSECDNSFHASFIEEVGAKNIIECAQGNLVGLETISFETLLVAQPDAIIIQEGKFYKSVRQDPKWQKLKAVQNNQLLYVPKTPINWLDRPPSFMRLLGTQWLAHRLYGKAYGHDFGVDERYFFQLFFGYEGDEAFFERIKNPQ
ncbi:MAG: hypothetical protein KU37_03660 [Sulfuricurvum sp. PC08-66]|nr:MAG: hypothetical protein KU37_03660 [Sulfuricurvum sp. PC08-66]